MKLGIKKGTRIAVIGKTGSGKTFFIKNLLFTSVIFPILIIDTKADQSFDEFYNFNYTEFVDNYIDAINKLQVYPVVVYRPNPHELLNIELIDSVLRFIYDYVRGCIVVIDEAYSLHKSTFIQEGYFSLLTRGRSRDITVVSGAQRPKMLSRFILSECNEFYIFKLNDYEDRQRLYDLIPHEEIINTITEDYHFFYYNVETDELKYMSPIEESETLKELFNTKLVKFMKSKIRLI